MSRNGFKPRDVCRLAGITADLENKVPYYNQARRSLAYASSTAQEMREIALMSEKPGALLWALNKTITQTIGRELILGVGKYTTGKYLSWKIYNSFDSAIKQPYWKSGTYLASPSCRQGGVERVGKVWHPKPPAEELLSQIGNEAEYLNEYLNEYAGNESSIFGE